MDIKKLLSIDGIGWAVLAVSINLFSGCSKRATPSPTNSTSADLAFVISSNYSFTHYDTALIRTRLLDTLHQKGPFTLIVPGDDAFPTYSGVFTSPKNYYYTSIQNGNPDYLKRFTRYTILKGHYATNSLPFIPNTAFTTSVGDSIYVSKYLIGGDTLVTVNGSEVIHRDLTATNGIIQVIKSAILPPPNTSVATVIAGPLNISILGPYDLGGVSYNSFVLNKQLTLFSVAIQQAGLFDLLSAPGPLTIFAPSDQAFVSAGYASVADVQNADPLVLSRLVKNHIISGRNYVNDFLFQHPLSDTIKVPSLGTDTLSVIRASDPNSPLNQTIVIMSHGVASPANIVQGAGDVTCGNGVIHIIDQLLLP